MHLWLCSQREEKHTILPLQNSDAIGPASELAGAGGTVWGWGGLGWREPQRLPQAGELSGTRGPRSGPHASKDEGCRPQTWTWSSGGCAYLLADQD